VTGRLIHARSPSAASEVLDDLDKANSSSHVVPNQATLRQGRRHTLERFSGGARETASMPPSTCGAHYVETGGAQGGTTHFGSLYWGKSLTL
jgi:hypothetical protein